MRSPQKERGQQGDPDRRRELQRKDQCQRRAHHRDKPQVLARKMEDVAHEMQVQIAPSDLPQRSGRIGHANNDQHPKDRPERHDFKGIMHRPQFTSGYGHQRERGDRADHPEGRAQWCARRHNKTCPTGAQRGVFVNAGFLSKVIIAQSL